jgi:hypothetical protein
VAGLRARGGHTVDLAWDRGTLQRATVRVTQPGVIRIRSGAGVTTVRSEAGPVPVERRGDGLIEFRAPTRGPYELTAGPAAIP